MGQIIIIINAEIREDGKIVAVSPATETMVEALKTAITKSPGGQAAEIEVIPTALLWSKTSQLLSAAKEETIYCPLTIELPDFFEFPAQTIYQDCKDITMVRHWVERKLGYQTSNEPSWLGDFWLPVVLTAKGPIYGEVIGEGILPNSYEQPIDLQDQQRQQLYRLAYELLDFLKAPPSVYLLQFTSQGEQIIFDRLWPFPAAPALASLGVQQPDLFTCYWYCLSNQPISELIILG